MKLAGIFSIIVVACHAAWKWGGAGGTSYVGTYGTIGPVFLVAMLLWPTFIASVILAAIILFKERPIKGRTTVFFFMPILLYGVYFLIAGGSAIRAGIR